MMLAGRRLVMFAKVMVCVVTLMSPAQMFGAETENVEKFDEFQAFLQELLKKTPVENEGAKNFYARSMSFWSAHLEDYSANPRKYGPLLSLYHKVQNAYQKEPVTIDLDRFKTQIETFKRFDDRNSLPLNAVLFVGSSSIVFWETATAFPSYPVINRGIGGSTLLEVNHFYPDVIKKYRPAVIVIYCDNDVFMGAKPADVLRLFQKLSDRVAGDFPKAKIIFLSMKPQPMDEFFGKDIRKNQGIANGMIKDFIETRKNIHFVDVATPMYRDGKLRLDVFLPDGMHLNSRGYEIWNPIIERNLAALYRPSSFSQEP